MQLEYAEKEESYLRSKEVQYISEITVVLLIVSINNLYNLAEAL